LSGERLRDELDYWTERLRGLEPLNLIRVRPRPTLRSGDGDSVTFRLPTETVTGLKSLTSTQGGSLFMTGLAAFQILL
jgi:hypothetical protein